jgi:hypothetical protein
LGHARHLLATLANCGVLKMPHEHCWPQSNLEVQNINRESKKMLAEVLVLTYLLAYLAIKWLKYYKVPEDFPPGPPCVPGLGVLPFIKVSWPIKVHFLLKLTNIYINNSVMVKIKR